MNKELVVAVGIGLALGLLGAIYVSTIKPKSSVVVTTTPTVLITLKPEKKKMRNVLFKNLPKSSALVHSNTLVVEGEADNRSVIVAHTRLATKILKVKRNQFREEVVLKPGKNEVLLSDISGTKQQLKLVNLFYFKKQIQTILEDDKKATTEAELLKKKIEKQVMDLRVNAKKVVYGVIKESSDKELIVTVDSKPVKVLLEPEITQFFTIDEQNLLEFESAKVSKGMVVTAFISAIGDEEKSYTVYIEPPTVLVAGKISNIDTKLYQVSLVNFDKTTMSADVESNTTQQSYTVKTKGTAKYGFSKLSIGDPFFASLTEGKDGTYSLDRYLVVLEK